MWVIEVPSTTRPHAMTAHQCFGNALSAEISEKLKIEREKTGAPLKNHLQVYHQIWDKMYDTADDETRAKYEEEAKAFNAKAHGRPQQSDIYEWDLHIYAILCNNII